MGTHCWGTHPTTGLDITSEGHICHREHYPLDVKHYLVLLALNFAYQTYALTCLPSRHHILHCPILGSGFLVGTQNPQQLPRPIIWALIWLGERAPLWLQALHSWSHGAPSDECVYLLWGRKWGFDYPGLSLL